LTEASLIDVAEHGSHCDVITVIDHGENTKPKHLSSASICAESAVL